MGSCAVWQPKYRVEWDATDGRDGEWQARAFERVSLPGVGVGDAFQFLQEDFAGALRVLRAPAESVAEPLQTITAILPAANWSCLLLRIVLQDALSEVTKIYPPLKFRCLWMTSRPL